MIIDSSQIQFTAEHQKLEIHHQSRRQEGFVLQLEQAVNKASLREVRHPSVSALAPAGILASFFGVPGESRGSAEARSIMPFLATSPDFAGDNGLQRDRERLFQALLDAITQRSAELHAPMVPNTRQAVVGNHDATASNGVDAPNRPLPRLGGPRLIEVDVTLRDYTREEECTRFCAGGTVTTRDGQTLEFALNLEMSRRYEAVTELRQRETVVFTDPLVINFDGNAAELSNDRYAFDLDADGSDEWISFVSSNSALLALDRNQDGIINDGSELFGALSGNGFADLAAHDDDGNGFIDEGDAIFEQLQLWHKQADGEQLTALSDSDIGAIYLGATDTPFSLKGEQNVTLGQVRQSGIYLNESGSVGTVQQIDLAV